MTLRATPITVNTQSGEKLEAHLAQTAAEKQKIYDWSHHAGFEPAATEYRIY
ncbi:hypothetical protein H4R35_000099, partial [Dimargaris xerosporica]